MTVMKHVLFVDDVSTNLKCVALILKNKYNVTTLKSGREALDCMKTVIPDLVLLDIHMQEMDGYEVLKHMKENPRTAGIPVILVTADAEADSEKRGIALGAVGFVRKPFEPQTLLDEIEAVWKTEE